MDHKDDDLFRADSKEATRIFSLDDIKENQAKLEKENDDLRQEVRRLNQTVTLQSQEIQYQLDQIKSLEEQVTDATKANLDLSESLMQLSLRLAEEKGPGRRPERPRAEIDAKSVTPHIPNQGRPR